MPYRFVHAADIHLDSPLRSLAMRSPELAELIGNATRQAFVRIVDLCLRERVNALIIAGDLYDGEQTSMKTARFLGEQMRRLHEARIRVFVIRGNHDAGSQITRELVFPETVKVFGGRAEAVAIERERGDLPIVVHGLSFAESRAPESLVGKYRPPVPGAFNIGILHTSLAGSSGHDPYAPCSLAELHAAGFEYWALGHIHKRSVHTGKSTIVMPGMPQGRDINEAGVKSVSLVTVADDLSVGIEERFTSIAQFERIEIDTSRIEDWAGLARQIGEALRCCRTNAASEHVIARIGLSGSTPLAWRMRRDGDLLKAEADDRAAALGGCWVEKLEVRCQPPLTGDRDAGDPLTELRRLIADEVAGSDAFLATAFEVAEELRGQLPPECRHIFGEDEAAFGRVIAGLLGEGTDNVMARLHADAEAG